MRASEFITEDANTKHSDFKQTALPGARSFPNVDQFYELYRLSMAMASAGRDDANGDPHGPIKNQPVAMAYTDGEEQIIKQALKKMGKSQQMLTTKGSQEEPDTYTVSPVIKRK
jgi:hypothetical protein